MAQAPEQVEQSWSFENQAQTLLFSKAYTGQDLSQLPGWGQKQQTQYDTSAFRNQAAMSQLDFSSPSESSTTQESWPPFISNNQAQWRPAQQIASSPSLQPPNASMTATAFTNRPPNNQQAQVPPPANMPFISGKTPSDDSMMLDIDWVRNNLLVFAGMILTVVQNEWDQLFPPDQNTGKLDISPPSQLNGMGSG